jgi:hypothetical protein
MLITTYKNTQHYNPEDHNQQNEVYLRNTFHYSGGNTLGYLVLNEILLINITFGTK